MHSMQRGSYYADSERAGRLSSSRNQSIYLESHRLIFGSMRKTPPLGV